MVLMVFCMSDEDFCSVGRRWLWGVFDEKSCGFGVYSVAKLSNVAKESVKRSVLGIFEVFDDRDKRGWFDVVVDAILWYGLCCEVI